MNLEPKNMFRPRAIFNYFLIEASLFGEGSDCLEGGGGGAGAKALQYTGAVRKCVYNHLLFTLRGLHMLCSHTPHTPFNTLQKTLFNNNNNNMIYTQVIKCYL